MEKSLLEGLRIIIDLGFDHLMTDAEMKSLAQQLVYCYSANTKAETPSHLIFTDFQGETAEQLDKQSPAHSQWFMTKHQVPYIDAFKDR